ncbi:hypothetical protein F5Y15DRAFT_410518 [Xylariaceae sp. FL0016]|nr:hypothetical protein F5Y15DRAFT_410518 [Xylariaceae sp. FL0016]
MGHLNTGALGWVYIGLTVAWTVILGGGMGFLWRHRQLPSLQIRRLPLVFTAVILLHGYGSVCMISWTLGSLIPCNAAFWVMSIYLPFGMALLQAANSQFQHIASQQQKFAKFNDLEDRTLLKEAAEMDASLPWWKRAVEKIRRTDKTTRIVVYISMGMVLQLLLTLFVYFGSEMFHPSYGFFHIKVPGTEQRESACFEGWEWWLSIVWQFFWAWFYAPYMLWKTRNVNDTHGWRLQTICCCIAGLPASPMWLIALYTPQLAPLNAVIIPPQWFSISIFFIEVFTIFIPCWQVVRTQTLQQETLDAIAAWEERNKGLKDDGKTITTSGMTGTTLGGRSIAGKSRKSKGTAVSQNSRKSETLTMDALESALSTNPQPLLEFAALKDFSGENISFLSHVADWKRAWTTLSATTGDRERQQFIRAVRIYSHFVSMEWSEFPVNISSRVAKELHNTFAYAARKLNRPTSLCSTSATPFDDAPSDMSTSNLAPGLDLEDTLGQANLHATKMADLTSEGHLEMPIPESFSREVFDVAEREIKYLVLTNTWPKFVNAGFENASAASKEGKEGPHYLDSARKYFCGIERIA